MDNETRKAVAASLISAAEKLEEIRPTTMMDVVDAIHSGDLNAITASSLGRIWEHTRDLTKQSFVMISASRASFSDRENIKRTNQLQEMIRGLGYGYVRLIGHWLECQAKDDEGNPVAYDKCPDDMKVDVTEASLFIPNMSWSEGRRLALHFNQDSFVYGGPESDGLVKSFISQGGVYETLGDKFTTKVINKAFSSLYNATRTRMSKLSEQYKDRRFTFVGVGANSPGEALSATAYENSKYGVKKFHSVWGQQ